MPTKHEWRATATAYAPNGVNAVTLCEFITEHAQVEMPEFGPIVSATVDAGKRWVQITFSFSGRGRDSDESHVFALLRAARVFSRFGMTITCVEMEATDAG